MILRALVRAFFSVAFFSLLLTQASCFTREQKQIPPKQFLEHLESNDIEVTPVLADSHITLTRVFEGYSPIGVYEASAFLFALYDIPHRNPVRSSDQDEAITIAQNMNLFMVGKGQIPLPLTQALGSLKPNMGIKDLGVFVYPLGLCMILSLFVMAERSYSLRKGLTFPRKVEKALRLGEFPDKKWKKRSSAERIAWVATREKPSPDSLRSYCALEVSALEQGMFLLEVVIAGAPLVGLLGTVTGLVQVFSAMPESGSGQGVFSEGIAMALLTTIIGLAIAIPTLFVHSYLMRIIEKRAASLEWLTTRLLDATLKDSGSMRLSKELDD